jgi:DNA polymerase-1
MDAAGATLLTEMELPLSAVLADMELAGVQVDAAQLAKLSDEFGERARALERECHELAGEAFAVGSPKQLGEILFGKLKLDQGRRIKKTKTGYSTDSSVLEQLSDVHPLPDRVVAWRSLTKLKSTYTDALGQLVVPETGRVHTVFNQAVASTGRLSSTDPNLQNIPIRTEEGRRIRVAFVAAAGSLLLAADYGQIELRLLAHLCGSETMQQAFRDGVDIHQRTASEVFGVPLAEVTRQQRTLAKTVNFGILYGMGPGRLAREQKIAKDEAVAIIARYFERYPAIRAWKEETLSRARAEGVVRTLFGRLRRVPDLRSSKGLLRANAERVAINTPVQGSAADIIKRAMIAIHQRLAAELPDAARMLLTVHDELVFEVQPQAVAPLRELVIAEMEGAATLSVPLTVNAAVGANWLEAH